MSKRNLKSVGQSYLRTFIFWDTLGDGVGIPPLSKQSFQHTSHRYRHRLWGAARARAFQ